MTIDPPAGDGERMLGAIPAITADVAEVEVVVAHSERATLRVGDVFLKIDADQTRTDVEVCRRPWTVVRAAAQMLVTDGSRERGFEPVAGACRAEKRMLQHPLDIWMIAKSG